MSSIRSLLRRIGLLEVIALITGFVLMAFELAASRMLAPAIGTSIYVWTSVIGVMIAALAVGYASGGWLADKRAQPQDIAWLLLAAAFTMLTTCVLYQGTLDAIGTLLHDPRAQGVVASLLLFAPTSFLLGASSPYLAKLRVKSTQTTGRSVAGLSAANSVGGIVGTFCTGFLFFSLLGLRETATLLAGLLIATSWLVTPRLQHRPRVIATTVLAAVMLLQFVTPARAGTLASIDTPTAHYDIANGMFYGEPIRVLVTGPYGWQSGIYTNDTNRLVFDYTRKLAEVVAANPHRSRILILGGGAFTLPEYLGRQYPQSAIDVAEIDPQLTGIAERYFDYQPPANVRTFAQDARTYLKTTANRYDIVLVDVYNDSSVPQPLTTQEYVDSLKGVLAPGGVVAANLVASASPRCMPLLASLHQSYAHAFTNSRYYPLNDPTLQEVQNIIALYANTSLSWADTLKGSEPIHFTDARTLTDNYAPVELLKQRCGD